MRKECDDSGPLAELEYWKQRTSRFSCLVDQIKSQPCRGVITTLVAAKSRAIKVGGDRGGAWDLMGGDIWMLERW